MTVKRRRLPTALVLVGVLLGSLGACGDDDDGDEAGATTTAAETTETTAAGDGGDGGSGEGASEEVCTAYTDVTLAFSGEPDPEQVSADLDALEEGAPEDIAEPLQVMVDAARTVVDSGGEDFSAFEAPEFAEAQGEVDPYFFESCEYDAKVEVSAVDYGFEGIPSEVPAGKVAMLVTNDGSEAHEMAVMRKAEGVTESFDEILALPEEEGREKVEEAGGTFVPAPGAQGLMVAEVEPGEYAAVCFIPVGTTGPDAEGDGPPHFTEGMVTEFTVTG